MKYILFCTILCWCLVSCREEEKTDAVAITFEVADKINKSISFEVLNLNTPDSLIVGDIDLVQFYEDKIFLQDANAGLLVFDLNGNFLAKIGREGRGPTEYIVCRMFTIDPYNNLVLIIDSQKEKILEYSLTDYSFIRESVLPNSSGSFEPISKAIRVWANGSFPEHKDLNDNTFGFNYLITRNDTVIHTFSDRMYDIGFITGPWKSMYKQDSVVKAYAQHSPFLYVVSGTTVVPEYKITVKNMPFASKKFLNKITANRDFGSFYSQLSESNFISYSRIMETSRDLLFYCFSNSISYIGTYDKEKAVTQMCKMNDFKVQNGIKLEYLCGATKDAYVFAVDVPDDTDKVSDDFRNRFSKSNSNTALLFLKFN